MSTLRLVLAWLVMAALPPHGIAAASMLFCEKAAHSTVAQPAGGHDHAAHGHGANGDHASHSHDGDAPAKTEQPSKLGGYDADGPQGGAGLVDDGHACPVCASCCNLVALSETPTLVLSGDSPESHPVRGPARMLTRHAPTPDKPPRA